MAMLNYQRVYRLHRAIDQQESIGTFSCNEGTNEETQRCDIFFTKSLLAIAELSPFGITIVIII